jgi:hypothetical protein
MRQLRVDKLDLVITGGDVGLITNEQAASAVLSERAHLAKLKRTRSRKELA